MGFKGDKLTNNASEQTALLVEKLQILGSVKSKKMFGGFGVFHQGKMFGIVNKVGDFFLKFDDTNAHRVEELNSEKHGKMPYYYIPEPVVLSDEVLIYAEESIRISKK